MHQDGVGVAGRQQVGADADRSAGEEAAGRGFDHVGQLHAAPFVVLRGAEHAAIGIGLARFVRATRQNDLLAVEMRLLRIHRAVEWRVLLARNALASVEHGIESLARVVREAAARHQRFGLEPVVDQEVEGGAQRGGHAGNYGRANPRGTVR